MSISGKSKRGDSFVMGEIKFYKKKPVVVSAYQTEEDTVVRTLEGNMLASKGSYIITGIHGEIYPCQKEIFKRQVKIDRKLTLVKIFAVLYFIVIGLAGIALILGILHIFPNSDLLLKYSVVLWFMSVLVMLYVIKLDNDVIRISSEIEDYVNQWKE